MDVLFSSSFSAVEKHRQYHDHEETAEMIAARIDRDVVSEKLQTILLNVCETLQLYFVGRIFPHEKFIPGGKLSRQPVFVW